MLRQEICENNIKRGHSDLSAIIESSDDMF